MSQRDPKVAREILDKTKETWSKYSSWSDRSTQTVFQKLEEIARLAGQPLTVEGMCYFLRSLAVRCVELESELMERYLQELRKG